ncbi:hypothetical protein CF327_g1065 [Tilletia walkeri]|uniref:Uncharacterized protein n=1 Tax=Tilletia walkeri TaxID=117179 RepID=A0A8X7NGB5_9BASI|nr:hypothetical protein CF327_g1065 [Tilletia walkeri]KAE8271446.1 hypothetical protein A4X09_0g904 [Tilletia walkeri]
MRQWILAPGVALLRSSHSLRPRLIPAPSTSRATLREVPSLASFFSSESSEGLQGSVPVPPKRKRGRPPKVREEEGSSAVSRDPATSSSGEKVEETGEETPVKRKRGRPRKTAINPSIEKEEEETGIDTAEHDAGHLPRPDGQVEDQETPEKTLPSRASNSKGIRKLPLELTQDPTSVDSISSTEEVQSQGVDGAPLVNPMSPAFLKIVEEERHWEANPWMHMLSSPLRRCCVSKSVLPTDLLLCFKQASVTRPGTSIAKTYILPDRILHTKFAMIKPGKGIWVLSSKSMIDEFLQTCAYRRQSSTGEPPEHLMEMINHQLRQRVLQEAELLTEKVSGSGIRSSLTRPAHGDEYDVVAYLDLGDDAPVMGSTTSFGQPVTFGLRRLMGLVAVDAPSSEGDHPQESQQDQKSPETQDKLEGDFQALLKDLAKSDPVVVSGSPVLVIRKSNLAVPLFIALYRLARFIQ